jgi:uncharacterized protein (TIGR02246 family)
MARARGGAAVTMRREDAALAAYWRAVEDMDADAVADRFACNGTFVFGGGAPLRGRAAIRGAFVQLFAETERIEQQPVALWRRQGLVVAESDITITFDGGSRTVLPATTILWIAGETILSCRFSTFPDPALARAMNGFATPSVVFANERGWSMQTDSRQ